MTVREKAEELRQEAISALLDEKAAIEEMLKTLGYDPESKAATKKRGRPSKQDVSDPAQESANQGVVVEELNPALRNT